MLLAPSRANAQSPQIHIRPDRGLCARRIGLAPRTEQDLLKYCYHVAGAVGCMMAIIMGVDQTTKQRSSALQIWARHSSLPILRVTSAKMMPLNAVTFLTNGWRRQTFLRVNKCGHSIARGSPILAGGWRIWPRITRPADGSARARCHSALVGRYWRHGHLRRHCSRSGGPRAGRMGSSGHRQQRRKVEMDHKGIAAGNQNMTPGLPGSAAQAALRGARNRCPSCGQNTLFLKFLKPVSRCRSCDQDWTHQQADDFPAYLAILLTGHILAPLIIALVNHTSLPVWGLMIAVRIFCACHDVGDAAAGEGSDHCDPVVAWHAWI